jgi:ankyrin repeat protein
VRLRSLAWLGGCALVVWGVAPAFAATPDVRLVEVVKTGQVAQVRTLLQQQVDVNKPAPDGTTALHWAVQRDDIETATLLLAHGARPNVVNDYGVTPLGLACTNASAAMVKALLRSGADPNAVLQSGARPLMTASRTGNPEVVAALLEAHADLNAKEDGRGQTALMWAAAEGHVPVVRMLLEHGADVHAKSRSGSTALLLAARDGDFETTRVLMAAGANVNEASADGTTPLAVATIRGHSKYVEFLLNQGADPNIGPGFLPLHWSVGNWGLELAGDSTYVRPEGSEWEAVMNLVGDAKLDLVKLLLAHGANVNARAQGTPRYTGGRARGGKQAGATAFAMAAMNGDVAMMRLLLAHGADPLIGSDQGVSPLMFAAGLASDFDLGYTGIAEKDAFEAVKLCYELGNTNVNQVDKWGETALHGAAYRGLVGSSSIIQFLADRGATINVANKRGWTPMTIAEGVYNNVGNTRNPESEAVLRKLGAEPSRPGIERDAYALIDVEGNLQPVDRPAIPTNKP